MEEIDILSLYLIISQNIQRSICWKIKRIRSDRGHEYESSAFNSFIQFLGIIHETTAPYSSASNGVAEKKIEL